MIRIIHTIYPGQHKIVDQKMILFSLSFQQVELYQYNASE